MVRIKCMSVTTEVQKRHLTVGRVYKAVETEGAMYCFKGDEGDAVWFRKDLFREV